MINHICSKLTGARIGLDLQDATARVMLPRKASHDWVLACENKLESTSWALILCRFIVLRWRACQALELIPKDGFSGKRPLTASCTDQEEKRVYKLLAMGGLYSISHLVSTTVHCHMPIFPQELETAKHFTFDALQILAPTGMQGLCLNAWNRPNAAASTLHMRKLLPIQYNGEMSGRETMGFFGWATLSSESSMQEAGKWWQGRSSEDSHIVRVTRVGAGM